MGQAFNDITGEAIRTGGSSAQFRSGYDSIDWSNTCKTPEPIVDVELEADKPE